MKPAILVSDKNVRRFRERKHMVRATARSVCGKYYGMEYESASQQGRLQTAIINAESNEVWHFCKAMLNLYGCWHLGGLVEMAGISSLPHRVYRVKDKNVPEIAGWINTTKEVLGRSGNFQILTGNTTGQGQPTPIRADEDEDAVRGIDALRRPCDNELDRYELPEKVLLRVLKFRRAQEKKIEKGLLTDEQVARIPEMSYIPQGKEVVYGLSALTFPVWVGALAVGPKGSGKNTFVKTLFGALKLPMTRILGGLDMNGEALLGGKTLEPETMPLSQIDQYKLRAAAAQAGINLNGTLDQLGSTHMRIGFESGLLLEAVEKGEGLFFDEINFSLAEVLCLTNGLIGMQKMLAVPGRGIVDAPESFRFAAAMNYGYAGTRPLNQALQDRLRVLEIGHLPKKSLSKVLVSETGCAEEKAHSMARVFHLLAERVTNGDLSDQVLSVRALKNILLHDMDGIDALPKITISCLTEGLNDLAEKDIVRDIVEANIAS